MKPALSKLNYALAIYLVYLLAFNQPKQLQAQDHPDQVAKQLNDHLGKVGKPVESSNDHLDQVAKRIEPSQDHEDKAEEYVEASQDHEHQAEMAKPGQAFEDALSEADDEASTPQHWLLAHNAVRARVGVPPLVWNKTLEEYATEYAEKRDHDCDLEHSMGPYGENLASAEGHMDAAQAVAFWAIEELNYNFQENKCAVDDECGHYTQMIWHQTTQLGCARATCDNNKMFVICCYDPPGNIEGERPY